MRFICFEYSTSWGNLNFLNDFLLYLEQRLQKSRLWTLLVHSFAPIRETLHLPLSSDRHGIKEKI